MEIKFGQNNVPVPPNPNQRGRVVVSMNPVKERVFVDADGNEYDSINPRTRKLIKRADQK